MSNVDRQINKEKTGVFTGAFAVNPVNNQSLPIWISSYVLMEYGTGAIMAVPAHDDRDFEFAQKYEIPIVEVIYSENALRHPDGSLQKAFTGDGRLINSGFLDGLDVGSAKQAMIDWLADNQKGEETIHYKLRDWIFARQRYWGEPIPVVYCARCGIAPVPYDQLPVRLPDVKSYKPTSDGTSPLAEVHDWVHTACPKCGAPAKRETDTMPQWAGSSWYFLRYPDRDNQRCFASEEALKAWLPVDMYVGGIEHAVLHLLYARFWTKILYDEKLVPFNEPFTRLFNQGMVIRRAHRCSRCNRWVYDSELGITGNETGVSCPACGTALSVTLEKMSKSKGNGVSPDPLVAQYGTDALRLYELFIGDPALDSEWNGDGIKACHAFLRRSWEFIFTAVPSEVSSARAAKAINRLIYNIEQRLLAFKFNTAVSAMMEFVNEALGLTTEFAETDLQKFIIVISPFAPHFSEEVWHKRFNKDTHVFHQALPAVDKEKLLDAFTEYVVQINGKVKFKISVPLDSDKNTVLHALRQDRGFLNYVKDKKIEKEIFVPGKLVSVVLSGK
jgi:leucyl-tRNA synthetase